MIAPSVVLLGPTASGKTALGIALAQALRLDVINVDSRQLYRDMTVGTAKPTPTQQATVRHHLLDLRPRPPLTLQEFPDPGDGGGESIHPDPRQRPAGGGQRALPESTDSRAPPPAVPPQPTLRSQLGQLGQPICHGLLRQADPAAGQRIAPADAVRTQRALEVLYATGRTMTAQQSATPSPWRVLELGLNPADLRQRIAQRTRQLYAQGLVAETAQLRDRYGADLPLLQTIGYGEALQELDGHRSRAGHRHHDQTHPTIRQTPTHLVPPPASAPLAAQCGPAQGSDDTDQRRSSVRREVTVSAPAAPLSFLVPSTP